MPTEFQKTVRGNCNCCSNRCDCPDCCRCRCCCHCPVFPIVVGFTAIKRDLQTGMPLAGALYSLSCAGRPTQTATSNALGELTFTGLSRGYYTLQELQAPAGYIGESGEHLVTVYGNGEITIDGYAAEGFSLYNSASGSLNFSFLKVGAQNDQPLPGAVFTLSNGSSATSDAMGLVNFGILAPGNYTMQETVTPAGYLPNNRIYQIAVAPDGSATVDGLPINLFTVRNQPSTSGALRFVKRDLQTGLPLAGAVFQLSNSATAQSDISGVVDFGVIAPGSYTLQEIVPPAGYLPDNRLYSVQVTAAGQITVDGTAIANFSVNNSRQQTLRFYKYSALGNQPLAGATFQLSNGVSAVSGPDGLVDFGILAPGDYTLAEISAPAGYQPDPRAFLVSVAADGQVTVNGQPAAGFSVTDTPAL